MESKDFRKVKHLNRVENWSSSEIIILFLVTLYLLISVGVLGVSTAFNPPYAYGIPDIKPEYVTLFEKELGILFPSGTTIIDAYFKPEMRDAAHTAKLTFSAEQLPLFLAEIKGKYEPDNPYDENASVQSYHATDRPFTSIVVYDDQNGEARIHLSIWRASSVGHLYTKKTLYYSFQTVPTEIIIVFFLTLVVIALTVIVLIRRRSRKKREAYALAVLQAQQHSPPDPSGEDERTSVVTAIWSLDPPDEPTIPPPES